MFKLLTIVVYAVPYVSIPVYMIPESHFAPGRTLRKHRKKYVRAPVVNN